MIFFGKRREDSSYFRKYRPCKQFVRWKFLIKIIKLNMKVFFAVLLSLSLLSCNETKKTKADTSGQIKYELVTGWPELSKGYALSQPTGIGIDKDDHIFVFHRTGRKWTTPFPDSLISQNTVLELDNESGKIINSWGANYFINS
jgi:peptidylamidoglycolate lyase